MKKYNFASDTTAPVHPEILKKMIEINSDYEPGYSQDVYTQRVREIMQKQFSKPVECHFCSSGSAANVLAIKTMKQNYTSIICCDDTHINRYEVGGVEFNTGCKIVACNSDNAKITVDDIQKKLLTRGNYNYANPGIVVISQVTELGTCYTPKEIKKICDFCHANDLYVYMDGARLANALVFTNSSFKEMLEDTGVDICNFGGNKNGCMFGEMLIFLNTSLCKNFILQQKQSMQLFSKTRYLGAQFLVMLEKEIWKENAQNANNMAIYLEKQLKSTGITLAYPVESNAVFANLNKEQLEHMQQYYVLSPYDTERTCCRIMTNWNTKKEEIDEFIKILRKNI